MRNSSLALAMLAAITAVLPVAASPAADQNRVLKTRDPVSRLAADGVRVAIATTAKKVNTCAKIVVWNTAKRSSTGFKTGVNCETGSTVNNIPEIALAGTRVAWLEAGGGNYLDTTVKSLVLGSTRTATVSTTVEHLTEGVDGGWIRNLTGDGSLLVYNRWQVCTAYPADVDASEFGPHCDQPALGDRQDYVLSEQKLFRVVAGKSVEIASAPDAQIDSYRVPSLAVVSVDAGRIATQDASGQMTVSSANGTVLEQIAVPSGSFAGTALQGSRLVTLRNGKLEVYGVSSGELVKTIPLATGSVLRDLQGGLAVSVRGRKVQVVRLSDGKKLTFSPPGTGSVDTQIESSGLFYSYNFPSDRDHGRIAFVPYAKLLKNLG